MRKIDNAYQFKSWTLKISILIKSSNIQFVKKQNKNNNNNNTTHIKTQQNTI